MTVLWSANVSQASVHNFAKNCICCRFLNELEGKEELVTHALPYLIIRSLNRGIVSQLTETLVLLEGFLYDLEIEQETKQKQQTNRNRVIWLVYWVGTNAHGFWLVKRTPWWKNFMPENFLEINRYFALISYCNTIGQLNNALSILGFSLAGKKRSPCFDLFIHWLIKQITNTYLNHFSRSYENHSNLVKRLKPKNVKNPGYKLRPERGVNTPL